MARSRLAMIAAELHMRSKRTSSVSGRAAPAKPRTVLECCRNSRAMPGSCPWPRRCGWQHGRRGHRSGRSAPWYPPRRPGRRRNRAAAVRAASFHRQAGRGRFGCERKIRLACNETGGADSSGDPQGAPSAYASFVIAAPNGFTFFLGEHQNVLGPTTLYEWDLEGTRSKSTRGSHVAIIA